MDIISEVRRKLWARCWWRTPFIPALGRQRQMDLCKLKFYRVVDGDCALVSQIPRPKKCYTEVY